MKHTEQCLRFQEKLKREHEAFLLQWPKVCRICSGAGGHTYYEHVPYGSTYASMPVGEPCQCAERGICPRCGEQVWDVETEQDFNQCPKCGWTPFAATLPPAGLEEPCQCAWDGLDDLLDKLDDLDEDFYAAFKGEQ